MICLLYLCVLLETPDTLRNRTVATQIANLCQVCERDATAAPQHGGSAPHIGLRIRAPHLYKTNNTNLKLEQYERILPHYDMLFYFIHTDVNSFNYSETEAQAIILTQKAFKRIV